MLNTIHSKNDPFTIPIHLIIVELGRDSADVPTAVIDGSPITGRRVHGTLDIVLVVTPVLHNVDLTAVGPVGSAISLGLPVGAGFIDVLAQGPDGGPGAGTGGQFCSNLYTPIFKGVLGVESGRGVLLGVSLVGKGLFFGNNFQGAVADIGVGQPICVVLYLTVVPAGASRQAGLVEPLA